MTRLAAALAVMLAFAPATGWITSAWATPQSDLMDADRAFSRLSETRGRPYAFLSMAMNNARLFGDGAVAPIYNRAQAFRSLGRREAVRMRWVPAGAGVSADGRMGWTDGRWEVSTRGAVTGDGHYLTVWVKDRRGIWKVQANMRTNSPAKK
jgi:hypothetical protein